MQLQLDNTNKSNQNPQSNRRTPKRPSYIVPREGMTYDGLSFPAAGCLEPDVAKVTWYEIINVWDSVSAFIPLPRMFLSADFRFETQTGQVTMNHIDIMFTS